MIRRLIGLAAVVVALATGAGCLENFERLLTHVAYDPVDQSYAVEQTLANVSASFLACSDVDGCRNAIWRALAGQDPGGFDSTLADRLVQRLQETGAQNIRFTLHENGDALDVLVRYTTTAGSRAADDTLVKAEWGGKPGKEQYYLVVDSQPGMEPLDLKHTLRKVAGGAGWAEQWVLQPGEYDVHTSLAVDDAAPIFAAVPGLADALAPWLDHEYPLGSPPPEPTGAAPVVAAAPAPPPVAAPTPAPAPVSTPVPVAAPAPPPAAVASGGWPPPDPTSEAKVWVFDPRISGGYPDAQARAAFAPILPRIEWCYQQRVAAVPGLTGFLFLDAVIHADGSLASTSAYGEVPDRALLDCANRAIEDWHFAAFSGADQAEVSIPLTLRIEAAPEAPGKRKR